MKLVTLLENTTTREDLLCEHGLSLYIETGSHKILFDAGQSSAFAANAESLGIDLAQVNFAVLSHGHYDHGGGLPYFLSLNSHAPVYVNRHAFEPHFNAQGRDIGLSPSLKDHPRLLFTGQSQTIAPGITLHTLPLPPTDTSSLTVMEADGLQPEDFRHEQYLLIEEEGKRILLSGCSHKGIVQIAQHFRPDILIGGFHFMKVTDEAALRSAAETLLQFPTTYYTCHCTGQPQFAFLKSIMGPRLQSLSTGTAFRF